MFFRKFKEQVWDFIDKQAEAKWRTINGLNGRITRIENERLGQPTIGALHKDLIKAKKDLESQVYAINNNGVNDRLMKVEEKLETIAKLLKFDEGRESYLSFIWDDPDLRRSATPSITILGNKIKLTEIKAEKKVVVEKTKGKKR